MIEAKRNITKKSETCKAIDALIKDHEVNKETAQLIRYFTISFWDNDRRGARVNFQKLKELPNIQDVLNDIILVFAIGKPKRLTECLEI